MLIFGSIKSTNFTHTQRERESALVPEQQRITRDYRMIRMFFLAGLMQDVHIKASWVHFIATMEGVDFPVTKKMKSEHAGH